MIGKLFVDFTFLWQQAVNMDFAIRHNIKGFYFLDLYFAFIARSFYLILVVFLRHITGSQWFIMMNFTPVPVWYNALSVVFNRQSASAHITVCMHIKN